LEIEKLKNELQQERTTKENIFELINALTSSITISKHLLDTVKPESFMFNQKFNLDNQSRQALNEVNQLMQTQSRIKQSENEPIEQQIAKTQNMFTASAKPQVK